MAEQIPVIQNKKLLLVALLLAGLVVVLFNVYVSRARQGSQTVMVELAVFARPIMAGDRVRQDDIKPVLFPQKYSAALPHVLDWSKKDIAIGSNLSESVREGEFVRMSLLGGTTEESLPSNTIAKGMTTWTFRVDRDRVPGNILLPNSRVNVVGMFPLGGKVETVVVISQVRVLAVGGRGPSETVSGEAFGQAQRSYNNLTVEVPPKIALGLSNLQTHALGDFWVQVLNPKEVAEGALSINPALESLSKAAKLSTAAPQEK